MTSVLPPRELALELHEINRRLRLSLDRLQPGPEYCSGLSQVPTPEQISGVLSDLLQAGECLRGRSSNSDPQLEQEVSEYRNQVERLRDLLPLVHRALLNERARLEQKRERVQAGAEWARASRQTL